MNRALGCITVKRLSVPAVSRFEVDREYAVVLNDAKPVRLRGGAPLWFSGGHRFRIVEDHDPDPTRGQFKVRTIEYWYQYETRTQDELRKPEEVITFHWNPEATGERERRYPHLHIGSIMLADQLPVLPGRFNKAHIPTSRVSLEAVIRFGIEELGVEPVSKHENDWDAILEQTEQRFLRYRTR